MFFKGSKFSKIVEILGLDKPLVIFDIETTGPLISTDKIVEIAYLKIWNNGKVQKDDIFLNPSMPIGEESTTIHGMTNGALQDKPAFRDKAQELFAIFNDCYYGGYNIINFDLPILRREFLRVGMDFEYKHDHIIDSKEIFRYLEPKNLSAAYSHYCRRQLNRKQRHSALADAETAAEIMLAQAEKYQEMLDIKFIEKVYQTDNDVFRDNSEKFYWHRGKTYFSFSKYKDRLLYDIVKEDPEFLHWILTANFSEETKGIIRVALEKKEK